MASANDGTLAGYRSVENILEDFLPKEQLDQVQRVLYGGALEQPPIPASVKQTASDSNFDIQHFAISAASEQTRPPRVVRVGLVQNSIQVPTDRRGAAASEQKNTPTVPEPGPAIRSRCGTLIDAAGQMGVQVLCLQEA
ncbi:CN hydrolase domain-containing protein, partial [Haematococcus lacustris]